MSFKDFTELPVWQKSSDLLIQVLHITKGFPDDERAGFTSDFRKSAGNISRYISEGYGTYEKPEKVRYYKNARANTYDVVNMLIVAQKMSFLNDMHYDELMEGYKRVVDELDSLIKSLETKNKPQPQMRFNNRRREYSE